MECGEEAYSADNQMLRLQYLYLIVLLKHTFLNHCKTVPISLNGYLFQLRTPDFFSTSVSSLINTLSLSQV